VQNVHFDFQAMENPDISGDQYQHGDLLYHKNFKQTCLVRDKLSNLMTLCAACHDKHHKEGLKLPRQKSFFYISAAHVQQGKNYLQKELSQIASLTTTFGYITGHYRNKAGIDPM